MEAGQTSSVSTLQGYSEGIIFPVFAAAVIGGVSLQGGRGNMVGAATGVILLGIVTNILNISQVSNYWIFAVQGGCDPRRARARPHHRRRGGGRMSRPARGPGAQR